MTEKKFFHTPQFLVFDQIELKKEPEPDGWNENIVETAGFIPLAVKFKQMEQAGIRAQFFASEFNSKDVKDMYLNHPEFDLTPEDDIEDAMEKIALRQAYINQVKAEAKKRNLEAQREEKAGESVAKASEKETASEEE